jgi:tRNA-2-methylthio-N6-dimethylallyladenosine synthase
MGTFYIETYGCQMNEHDSEKMAALLENAGFDPVSSASAADVVVINTCSIREKAQHKLYSALGKLKSLKTKNPAMVIVAAGCVAQQEQGALLARAGHLDAVVGTHRIGDLPAIVQQARQSRERVEACRFTVDIESLHFPAPCKGPSPVCSYVTVMQGCSNFCSYCVVPFTRGPELSRPAGEIVEEATMLAERGIKEITLLGQNVNAYGKDLKNGASFVGLLDRLDAVPGICRIRFTTSHPKDFGLDLAQRIAGLRSVCEHIHLPLQSGSDRILSLMGRGYTRTEYLEKVEMLRKLAPAAAITADMIVGFPGETDDDFEDTLTALEEIRFDQIFSFKFSARPGARAGGMIDQVPEQVKSARLEAVHGVQERITAEYHLAAEGTEEAVLIEGTRKATGQPFGRTRTNKVVNLEPVDGVLAGDEVRALITRGLKHSLLARVIS